MSCTKQDGSKCTKCCEVLGVYLPFQVRAWNREKYNNWNGTYQEFDKLRSMLIPVSKRRAKKINKYAVGMFPDKTGWFKCKNLVEGVGCGDYENRPTMCSDFGNSYDPLDSYSPTCAEDIKREGIFFSTKETD